MQAVFGIIFNSDRTELLLIERRDVPVWALPGGGLDEGETPEEGVCREVFEETGYKVRVKRKIAEYLPINRITHLTHFYECEPISGKPTTGSETRRIQFFPCDKLPKRLPPNFRFWIADALKNAPLMRKKTEGASYWDVFYSIITHPILVVRFFLSRFLGIRFNSK